MPRNFSRLVMVLGAALLAGAPALHAQAGQPVRGDVDGDGRVTAADARIVSDFLVGKPVPAGANVRERGDVNGDGRVTSVDAAIIARAAAGRDVSRFPVGTPVAEGAVAIVECAADVRARSISCGAPGTTGDARGNITVGGQNINVKLTNGPVTVTDSGTFEFTVTVQNLLHQTMAADSESTSPNVNGIRVFFVSGPTTTEGSGILEVHGSAQSSIFLTHTAPYYQYIGADLGANQILTPGDTSLPRLWRIKYDPGVSKFSFMLFLDTSVPYPKGWVDIYPPNNHYSSPDSVFADTVVAGRTLQLADSVRNPFGGSIPGAPVTWENKTSNGFATVNPSTGLVTTTALLNGVDSVTAKSGPRHGTVAIVVTAPSIANSLITAPASMTAGDSVLVKVQVKDGFGRNVTTGGDAVTLTTDLGTLRGIGAAGTTGVIAVDSANGRYTAWLKSTTAGTATVTGTLNGNAIGDNATVVIGAGTPVNMVKSAGDGQTATAGSAVAVAPAVTVTDGSGNPVAGVSVTFAVASGGGSVTGSPAVTNASGVATVGSWTLGSTAGANTLDASATGLTTVTFTATGVAGAAVNMVKSAGDGQSATAGLAVAVAPAVTVTDANANPVAGVSVTFAVASGGGSVTGSPAVTNASGVATVGSWTLGNTAGANTLDASATGLTTVTFTATGTPGAVDHFVVEAAAGGNIADQLSGTPFNVKVTARDIHNNTATAFTGTVGFTSSPGGGISAGAGPSLAFTAGVLSSHSITMSTPGAYTGLTATRTGGSEAGTSNSFEVQAPPTAVADGPTGSSAPGDPYHTAFNTTFNLATLGTLANDTRGFPLATVASFGGGDLGGTVTGHAGGSTVSPLPGHPDGSLTVNANGSLAFTPPAGFTGLYTFQYRISNVRGTSDAQVTVAVGVRPAAGADSYPTNLLGNVPINTATSSNFNVTSNDAGDAKVLALGTSTNGTTILNANGTFTFTPSAGYTGAASFTYTVTNGFATTAPATVSMTVSGIAWFVDKGAAAGDGRFGTPFNDLSTAFAAATKPLANQPIFLYASGTSYTGGVTLLGGQRLVGAGATGASFASVMGVTWPADAGAQPGIGGTSPTVVSGLTLGNGNTLQGFNLGGSGTLTGTSFGTLTVSEVGINTTGQALNLTTGTLSGSFTGVTSSGGTNNVALSGVTLSGGVGLGGGALSGASGSGLVITNGTSAGASDVLSYSGTLSNATAGAANATVAVSGGSTRLSLTGNVSQTGSGAAVSASGGHTGTLTFNTGTVSATNGTGLQFDNADGSYDFGSSPNLSLNGGDAGIDVQNGSGGTFTFASSAVITNPTAEAVRINASSPTFTYPGRITKTNGSTGITVSSNSSGTISFGSRSKAITSTGGNVAVNLATNGTATITFLDSLVIGSASGAGFNVTGGGTVSVQGANNTVNSTAGGTAVNVSSTTIAASGLTFKSVNATGSGTNGIVLSSTGSGPFTVTGDGNSDPNNTTRGRTTAKEGGGTVTLGSGGTISGRSGNGITLATTGAVTLHNMVITGSASSGDGINASSTGRLTIDNTRITAHASDHGLWGSTVSGLAIHHSEIDNNATTAGVVEGPDIWNVRLLELTGTDSIRNSNIHHSQEDVLGILNTSGTLNLTVLNTNITDTGTGAGGTTAFAVSASGTSNVTVNLQNDSINRGRARGVDFGTGTSSSAVFNTTINNSQFMQNGAAISIVQGSSGTNTFNITSNNLQSNDAGSLQAMIINRAGSPSFNSFGLFTGTISGNTIGTTAVANSGSGTSNGIDIKSNGSGGATRVAVVNNTIRQVGLNGISVAVVDGNTGGTTPPTMEARIQGNDISVLNAAIGADGINIQSGALNTDDVTMCVDIISNTSVGIRNGLRVRGSGAPTAPATVQLEGWDGSTARATYFANRPNTLSGGSGAYNENIPSAPGGYVAVASCNTP